VVFGFSENKTKTKIRILIKFPEEKLMI